MQISRNKLSGENNSGIDHTLDRLLFNYKK